MKSITKVTNMSQATSVLILCSPFLLLQLSTMSFFLLTKTFFFFSYIIVTHAHMVTLKEIWRERERRKNELSPDTSGIWNRRENSGKKKENLPMRLIEREREKMFLKVKKRRGRNERVNTITTFKHQSFSSLSSSWRKICVKPHRLQTKERKERRRRRKVITHRSEMKQKEKKRKERQRMRDVEINFHLLLRLLCQKNL